MKKNLSLLCILAVGLLFSSCSTSTQIVGSWQQPDVAQSAPGTRVFVAALTNNMTAKQKVEGDLGNLFTSHGFTVTKSLDAFPPNLESKSNRNKEALLQKLHDYNTDLIVTNSVIDKETRERYVGGGPYAPWGWAGNFWGYWGGPWGGGFYGSGYSTVDRYYYIETNIFDARSGKLVWSVQSRTDSPSSLDDFISSYMKAISQKLVQDGILKQQML